MKELLEALENDSLVKIKKLLEAGIDLSHPVVIGEEYDMEEPDEIGLLFYAIRTYASLEAIEMLLAYGLDLNTLDADKVSPLDTAIKFKRQDIVRLCLAEGVDLNSTERRSGILPLQLAACIGDIEMAKLLLASGARLDGSDKNGITAKDYAQRLGQKRMLAFLEEEEQKS